MHIVGAIVLFILQVLGASFVAATPQFRVVCDASENDAIGPNIVIYPLLNTSSLDLSCQGSWYRLVTGFSHQPVGNGNRFIWTEAEFGYGQFNCNGTDNTVEEKVFLLPDVSK